MRLSIACIKIRKSLDSFGYDIDWLRNYDMCMHVATVRAHPTFSYIYRQDYKKRIYVLNPNDAYIKIHLYSRKDIKRLYV